MGFLLSMHLKLVLLLLYLVAANCFSSLQSYSCHGEESSALLQFKRSFILSAASSSYDSAHPKTSSWKPEGGNSSCCSWEGVECNEETGHVIGLHLSSSHLYGSINSSNPLFHLVHLQKLDLSDNDFNYSQIPTAIRNFTRLRYLNLSASGISGQVPLEVTQLSELSSLNLSLNALSGPFSASLANLTNLTYLEIGSSSNNFNKGPLSWIGKLTKLTELHLTNINLIGYIPFSLENLTQLTHLVLPFNQLTDPIPSWVGNLSRLVEINLQGNELHGSIPESLFNLLDLKRLSLAGNALSGVVDIFMVQNLTHLKLGDNNLEVLTEPKINNATLPKFRTLGLGSCNVKEFPFFLRYQQNLQWLDLRSNKLYGQVPKWMWNTSTQTLQFLDISYNFLSGFDHPSPVILPWVNLKVLRLYSNTLYGPVPIPSPNILFYTIRDNRLVGEISPLICNLTNLEYLDLANNKLSGTIPQCLGNFTNDLRALDLSNNSFHGILPQVYRSNLQMIDVSHNKLQGKLPRSLANCTMLESIVLSENQFNDVFPFWLGSLPESKLLAMHHNGFYGVIENSEKNFHFPKLRILDLSYNNFKGVFPSEYLFLGNAMTGISDSSYMNTYSYINVGDGVMSFSYEYSITITNKGIDRYYPMIQEDLGVIDISSNNFEGKIPKFLGKLKGVRFLNISHNSFRGYIPSILGNLTLLESLDFSQNKLSGEIPQQLAELTFLAYFNVSYNDLRGPIPHGTQLTSLDISSYEGNPGLCGDPLPKKCGDSSAPTRLPPSSIAENNSGSGIELDWKFALAGVGSGLLVGVVLADMAIIRKRELFLEIAGMLIRLIKRDRREMLGYRH